MKVYLSVCVNRPKAINSAAIRQAVEDTLTEGHFEGVEVSLNEDVAAEAPSYARG